MAELVPFNGLPFDYAIVPQNEAKELRRFAVNIQSSGRLLTRFAIKIGENLSKAKRYLNHGDFEDWCRSEAGLSPRMAQLYMNLAKFAKDDRAALAGLALTAACKLAAPSTPQEVVVAVIGRVKRGEKVTLGEIADLVQGTKNKEVIGHVEDIGASKICALADDVRAVLNPLLVSQLSQFFDNATPALLQMFKIELNKKS